MKKIPIMSFRPQWRNLLGIKSKLYIKKKIQIISIGLITLNLQLIIHNSFAQNVGISTDGSTPESNTMLDIKSAGTTSATFGLKVKDSDGDEKVVVRSDGNVGIGTNVPGYRLEVNRSTSITNNQLDISLLKATSTGDMTDGFGSALKFGIEDNAAVENPIISINAYRDGADNNGALAFWTRNSGSWSTRMTIRADGDVGVGTTAPATKFHVLGNVGETVRIQGPSVICDISTEVTAGDRLIRFSNNSSLTSGGFDFFAKDAAYNSSIIRLQNNGNVGIGTTSPGNKLHVNGLPISGTYSTGDGARFNDGNYGVNLGGSSTGLYGWIQGTINGTGPGPIVMQKNGGNVGITTTSPGAKLHITGGTDASLTTANSGSLIIGTTSGANIAVDENEIQARNNGAESVFNIQADGGPFEIHNNQAGGTEFIVQDNGRVGIGTRTPSQMLTVYNGTSTGTYTTSGWQHSSDRKLKTNITEMEGALAKVKKLQGVEFNWKKNPENDHQIGFIAQDVEKVLPEVIRKDDEGNYTMAYGNLTAVLVEAIKEQQQIIENQKLKIASQDARFASLEKRMIEKDKQTDLRINQLEEILKTVSK